MVDATIPEIRRLRQTCEITGKIVREVCNALEAGACAQDQVVRARFGGGLRVARFEASFPAADDLSTEEITTVDSEVEFKIVGFSRGG